MAAHLPRLRPIIQWWQSKRIVAWVVFAVIVWQTVFDWLAKWSEAMILWGGFWVVLAYVGRLAPPIVGLLVLLAAYWNEIHERLFGPSFAIRPISGETLGLTVMGREGQDVIARLAIKNLTGKVLPKCSVRLVGAYFIDFGFVATDSGYYPSINPIRGESFLLRWSIGEAATADRKFLDMPPDGAERIADCLILDPSRPAGLARFTPANPQDIEHKLQGIGGTRWW